MLLVDVSKTLSAITDEPISTVEPSFYCQYRDKSLKDPKAVSEGSIDQTLTTIVSEPTQNSSDETIYDKIVDFLTINNKDDVNHRIKIMLASLIGADSIEMMSVLLLPGEKMEYTSSGKFAIYDANGVKKNDIAGGGGGSGNGYFPSGW